LIHLYFSTLVHGAVVSLQGVKSAPSSIFVPWDDGSFADMEVYLAQNGIDVLMASSDEGQHHVVADGLVSNDRCSELTQLDVVRLFTFSSGKLLSCVFPAQILQAADYRENSVNCCACCSS